MFFDQKGLFWFAFDSKGGGSHYIVFIYIFYYNTIVIDNVERATLLFFAFYAR